MAGAYHKAQHGSFREATQIESIESIFGLANTPRPYNRSLNTTAYTARKSHRKNISVIDHYAY
jgi:hypothetical protein